ncbi:ProQ/FinO family protein [Pararhizobium sp. BT-229]|uniref:ProQ/FinO family protein n=1 Tax=Pararhizobium sp. BT-229 TaxID=2986923 RepID=UPI0021F703E7|nr:ProQ/FinO family protein [Pararhizobium sp. BT-229]MCV9963754.1 ProQ/FinO family protein [Pararhizobium sp. BT-229]
MRSLRNSRKFRLYKQARREMTEKFPAAFPRSGKRPALKVGILDDIRQAGDLRISMTNCRRFLSIWTRSTAYLVNMTAGEPRVGLDGRHAGRVSDGHYREAKATLKRRKSSRERTTPGN